MISRVAYLSLHTSPLVQPGAGDAGGMNVYIDELARTMADRGVDVDVFTRRTDAESPDVVDVVDGYRVVHIDAGPAVPLPVRQLTDVVFDFAERVVEWAQRRDIAYDVVHSHYWLSGWAGLMVKRLLDIPLANSFHTLGRVKDATRRSDEPPTGLVRIAAEHEVIAGSNCVIASTKYEAEDLLSHYGADPTRLCISPPGVNHDVFRPGDRAMARRSVGLPEDVPVVLFVGRIQALKGIDVAIEAFAEVHQKLPDALLVVVGGPSGPRGTEEASRVVARVERAELPVRFVDPVPHEALAAFYQAADVVVFPSRSESFGLVAAEAQACGIPVVAARAGGLVHAVSDRTSGILVDGWDPTDYAAALLEVLTDPDVAQRLGDGAVEFARQFSWDATATRLLELYAGITGRS